MSDLPRAGVWRRQGAWWLDRALGLALWALCSMWLVLALWIVRGLPRELAGVVALIAALVLLGGALHIAYQVVFVGGCGQTPGQMACGVAVVRQDGAPAGYVRAAVRAAGGVLTALTLGLGLLVSLMNRDRRGPADLMAGTRVVQVRGRRSARGALPSGGLAWPTPGASAGQVSPRPAGTRGPEDLPDAWSRPAS